VDMWSFGCIVAEWLQLGEPLMQGTGDLDQINTIFRLLGTPSEQSWPKFSSMHAVQSGLIPFVENHTISLGTDGALAKLPKNSLRKRFPASGYTPAAQSTSQHRTTALSENGFELLNSTLTCDPEQRASAGVALGHAWFREAPLPTPLTRSEIRQLRRNRDEAISSGAHQQAIAQQRAQAASKVAAEQAAAIAATIKERMGMGFGM
jgi:cell division cycle 2-like protein